MEAIEVANQTYGVVVEEPHPRSQILAGKHPEGHYHAFSDLHVVVGWRCLLMIAFDLAMTSWERWYIWLTVKSPDSSTYYLHDVRKGLLSPQPDFGSIFKAWDEESCFYLSTARLY